MDYLFFDLECAKCRKGGVGVLCELAYVVVDKKFKIKEEKHLLINPCSSFDKYALEHILRYTKKEYESSPTLKELYDEIKKAFTAKKRKVIGHTTGLDYKYLTSDLIRNGLEPIEFEYYDLRVPFKELEKEENYSGVKNMLEKLELTVPDTLHNALTDTMETMLISKALCKKHNLKIAEMLKIAPPPTEKKAANKKKIKKDKSKNVVS